MQSPLRSAALGKHSFVPPADRSPAVLTYELCCGPPHRVSFHTKVHVKRQEAKVKPGFWYHPIIVNVEAMQLKLQKQVTYDKVDYHGQQRPQHHKIIDRRSADNDNCLAMFIILILLICFSKDSFQRDWFMRHSSFLKSLNSLAFNFKTHTSTFESG